MSSSDYCERIYEVIRKVNNEENRAVRRRELFDLLGWDPKKTRSKLD